MRGGATVVTANQWRNFFRQRNVRIIIFVLIGSFGAVVLFSGEKEVIWTTEIEGQADTTSYTVWLKQKGGVRKSFWHDVPLIPRDSSRYVVNFVNEIPFGTRKKFETQTKMEGHPLKQDTKKGKLREYTYGDTFFNYGGLPQTWEDPAHKDIISGARGDNDPVDAIEISGQTLGVGEIARVKVIGAYALVDQDELDWKILTVLVADPKAHLLNDVGDIEKVYPGRLAKIKDWFVRYKTTDGKPENKLLQEEPLNKADSWSVVEDTNRSWRRLIMGERPPAGLVVPPTAASVPLVTLLSAIGSLAEQAGAEILRLQKSDSPSLAVAEATSRAVIMDTLRDLWPSINFVADAGEDGKAEEVSVERPQLDAYAPRDPSRSVTARQSNLRVLVDVLDGARQFEKGSAGVGTVTVTACIIYGGKTVAGLIHQPAAVLEEARTVWGISGLGTDGFETAERAKGGKERVATSAGDAAVAEAVKKHGGELVEAPGAGHKALMLLDGQVDVVASSKSLSQANVCALDAILHAGGGALTDMAGRPVEYDAANGPKGVVATIRKQKADFAAGLFGR